MVGGKVVGLTYRADGTTRIVVVGTGHDRNRETTQMVRGHPTVAVGDSVWWQCGHLYWTPKGVKARGSGCGQAWDIPLERVR